MVVPNEQNKIQPTEKMEFSRFLTGNPIFGLAAIIKKEDTYVRTQIKFADSSSIYLNPIVRFEGDKPVSKMSAEVNIEYTQWLRLSYFLIAILLLYFYARRKHKISKSDDN